MIYQDAQTYMLRCDQCGLVWQARPARGKTHPTDSSLDAECIAHWRSCSPRRHP